MSRVPLFNSPLLLGFDQLERTLDRLAKNAEGYPPYNIERIGENGLRITLAVAGFTTDDLVIELVENQLIGARQADRRHDRVFLHRGIAARQFQRAFMLADGIEVMGARLDNGLLSIDLAAAARRAAHPHHSHRRRRPSRDEAEQHHRYHRAPLRLALTAAKEVAMENNANYCFQAPRGRCVPEPRRPADRLCEGDQTCPTAQTQSASSPPTASRWRPRRQSRSRRR